MTNHLHLTRDSLDLVCRRVISECSNIHLDQELCKKLRDDFLVHAQRLLADLLLMEVGNEILQRHPDIFEELYRVAHRARVLVERCCEKQWWRTLFTQACTSHTEEALDIIDGLQRCITEIWKIARLLKQPFQGHDHFKETFKGLDHFKETFKECEAVDRSGLLKKLEDLVSYLEGHAVLVPSADQNDFELSKFLLERIRVQVVSSIPIDQIYASLDFQSFRMSDRSVLGKGSAGIVIATDFLSIQCARKEQSTPSDVVLEECAKQALRLSKLSHPHVIKLFGFYSKKGSCESHRAFFLMELMSGSLYKEMKKGSADEKKKPFQLRVAVDIMIQIAKGVRYLHENDVSHRDLKCDNILVSRPPISSELAATPYEDSYIIKVTDFDQAKFFTSNCSDLQLQSIPNVGSTQWRAPECYTEKGKGSVVKVNPKKADSYSFAMTCYELLSVEDNPFDALPVNGMHKQKKAILEGTRPPIPESCPELLKNLIEDCWRKEARERPDFGEICRRLQDVHSVLLTETLSQRNRLCDSASASLKRPYGGGVVSMFKQMKVNAANAANKLRQAIMPEVQAPLMHPGITEAMPQLAKGDLVPKQEHATLPATKVIVGLDLGTTYSGVAYAKVSNPNEIHTISSWPVVGEEVYHCKTLSAIYNSTPNGDWLWGYQARKEYASRYGRGDGQDIQYFRELKQSLTKKDIGSNDLRPVVEYLRNLGKFVLDYLQHYEYHREYPEQEPLITDRHLRWCITVPSNWSSDSRERFCSCLRVIGGLGQCQNEDGTYFSTFDMFQESAAAARHCYDCFSSVPLEKGDKVCVLDIGSGNVQCVFEDWDDAERAQKIYGAVPSSAESLVKENFFKFISGKIGSSSRQFLDSDPSLDADLESLKVDPNHSIDISCRKRKCANSNDIVVHLDIHTSDRESIFKPLVDEVVSFLREQLTKTKVNVKRLFVVGGYAKHDYLMTQIKKSFPNFIINTPRNPGSAICKGAVALGLTLYSQFQARTQHDSSSNSEGGGQESKFDGGTRDADKNLRGQPGSSQKFNPSISRSSSAADSKGKRKVSAEDQLEDSLPEKILVALDFGTSQMGFAYSRASCPSKIIVCKDHHRRTTDLYYERQGDTLHFRSYGQKAKDDCRPDVLGEYVSKPKLHVIVDDLEPELELRLPAGLIIDDVISDCLREYGEFILQLLQEKFGKNSELRYIQWCLLVPSFWGENAKRQMRACMINAGLLKGAKNVGGSPYPLVTVLEAEAASIACVRSLGLCKGYDKYMVASIGSGTLDMVVLEWMGVADHMYEMKEASMGAGGYYGSSCLDINFLALLSTKMGAWMNNYLKRNPWVLNDLLSQWDQIKVGFSENCKPHTLLFKKALQDAWRHNSEQISKSGKLEESYKSLQLTSDDLKMIFEPVVRIVLERIAAQLARTNNVDVLVLVGGFAKSPYLSGHIKYRFRDQVKTLVRLDDSESAVLKGAVSFGLHQKLIRSRIARKTYGLGMSMDFQAGLHSVEEKSDEVERFRIDVEKGSRLEVDFCVTSIHKPQSSAQKNMKFSLYSSDESYPRYSDEKSVIKEWDFVVDISDSVNLDKERQIEIKLYYGRSTIEVEAKAVNLGDCNLQLLVTFEVGAMSERNAVVASFARKTYGIGTLKTLEKWDLPNYVTLVDNEEHCDFSFETFIRKGCQLDYFASRTLFPIQSKQEFLPFKVYSSLETSPVYVTDDVVVEEGALEIDIRKGLNVDKDREVSVRMGFSRTNIKISTVALNFAKPEERNLPIRLFDGEWETEVTLNLARHLRVVPLHLGALCKLQQDSSVTVIKMDEDWCVKHDNSSVTAATKGDVKPFKKLPMMEAIKSDVTPSERLCVMEDMKSITDEFENYDIFISHKGPDMKIGFVSFLYKDLVAARLRPFLDCKNNGKGQDSWECINHAIKMTPVALVIFSESFAQSEWCLKELHVMLNTPAMKVLPIFYNVQPWEVGSPEKGQLAGGFEKLKQGHDEILIELWREDLKKASKLNGWEYKVGDQRLERDLVKEIVGKVFELANKPFTLDVGEYVIGVDRVAEEIIQKLDDNKTILMLGLWGMGGIGKSTLARELYNRLGKRFATRCYIEDVTEKVNQGGVVKVQNGILKDLYKNESVQIEDKSKGKVILEESLCKKRLLLVLDNVRDNDEMDFCISRKMMTEGSMCIVTSRDRRVFEKSNSFDVNHEIYIHDVQLLSSEDSKRVFTSYAATGYWKLKEGFELMVANISEACGGVPRLLKVCGALLKDEENINVWEEVMKKLKHGKIMDENKIIECLWMSYNALEQELQEMFLDIACALLGQSVDMAIRVWKSQGWSAALGVRSLVEKALVTVDGHGDFSMHDHLRDMGREIARNKRASEGVCRSLWMPESSTLLRKNKSLPNSVQTVTIYNNDGPSFDLDLSDMKELRMLICDYAGNVASLLPVELRWFAWKAQKPGAGNVFPLVPPNNKLVTLILEGSNFHSLPKSFGELSNLEVLNLGHCYTLIMLPDTFSGLKNLQDLKLDSSGIQSLPESFGELNNLEMLNLSNCQKLIMLPQSFGGLQNLKNANLEGCGIRSLPESFGQLNNLEVLDVSHCIELGLLPRSFGHLKSLREVKLEGCGLQKLPESFGQLSNLEVLDVSHCQKLTMLPESLGCLRNLREVKLEGCRIQSLPDSLGQLSNLEVLDVSHCRKLTMLPESLGCLRSLRKVKLEGCGIRSLPESLGQLSNLEVLDVSHCTELGWLPESLGGLRSLREMKLKGCGIRSLPESLGQLSNLEVLDVRQCIELDWLPESLLGLRSLREMKLEGCRIQSLPESLGQLSNLEVLDVRQCIELDWLPESLLDLRSLREMKLEGCGI